MQKRAGLGLIAGLAIIVAACGGGSHARAHGGADRRPDCRGDGRPDGGADGNPGRRPV